MSSPPALAKPPPMQIVVNELAKAGWSCLPLSTESPTLQCPAEGAHRVAMRVTYTNADSGCTPDDPCFLRLASYDAPRAFGTPCEKFADAMSDLTIAQHHFSVTCNDTTTDPMTNQQFGFTTTITVADPNAPGVVAALPTHQADREAAIKKLVSIKAIQAAKQTGTREKHDVAH
ncbi:MAG: hypothetical protein ACRELY_13040 [Polyangiaceae bacterium]